MRFIFFALFVALVAIETSAFELPADWSSIRSTVDTSFSCIGRAYGYYSDVANDCQVYHVCQPRIENGITTYTHNPFICPISTVFDQKALACVHANSEFSCGEQVLHYVETENRLANVHIPVETVSVELNNLASPPERVEIPVVESNIVNQPIVNAFEDSNVAVNSELYGIPPSRVEPVVPAENVVALNNAPVLSTPVVSTSVLSTPVLSTPVVSVPVTNVRSVVSNVVSNDESAEVANVHSVSNSVGVVHNLPVLTRLPLQSQESVKMEQPSKGVQVTKSIGLPIAKREIEQVIKSPIKSTLQVQQVQQIPLKTHIVAPVKAPIQVVKAPLQQQVQLTQQIAVKAPLPLQQQVQIPLKTHIVVPVKAPIQVVKAPLQQQVQLTQQVQQIAVKAPLPLQQQVQIPLQQQVQIPLKSVKIVHSPVVRQQVMQQIVEQPRKVLTPVVQQIVEQPRKVLTPVVQQIVEQPRKALTPVVQQIVEQPRKLSVPLKQVELVRSHVNLVSNVQPSWRHHYVQLYPHLISNNPYHLRTVARLV